MRQREFLKLLKAAQDAARKDMAGQATGFYGAGLSSEGYAGGYWQALADVELAIRGIPVSGSRFWPSGSSVARRRKGE